jgi:uncharacterized membrane protein YvlD (DUF360 family)
MSWLLSWVVLSLSIWLTAATLPGFEIKGGVKGTLTVAALYGILSWLIGWLLVVLIGIGTLGIGFVLLFATRWLVTAILLSVTDALSDSLTIKSFKTAFLAALLMSLFGTLGEWLVHRLI